MPQKVKQGIAATILSFLGSSLVMGIVIFFLKDTVDKVNDTIDKVNKTQVSIQKFEDKADHLGEKITTLNETVNRTTTVLENYTKIHGQNLANMSKAMVRVTDRIGAVEEWCNDETQIIENCKKHLIKAEFEKDRK